MDMAGGRRGAFLSICEISFKRGMEASVRVRSSASVIRRCCTGPVAVRGCYAASSSKRQKLL